MIFIAVKWTVLAERSDGFLAQVDELTQAVRAEPGNLFFDWARSVDDPNTFVLLEAFADADAGAAHVNAEHFKKAMSWLPDVVSAKPKIINVDTPGDGWGEMGEVTPRG